MLKKLFIKDYKNINDNNIRNKYGLVAGIYGIISNIILTIIKLITGVISGSVSIIADAINNLSDSVTSILTIVGFKLSNRKPNRKHPYGYARYEYITGYTISLLILIIGIVFFKESIEKIFNPTKLIINDITFIVLIVSILIKYTQIIVYSDFSKIIQSNTLKTNVIDSRNDIISTLTILFSMIIMKIFNINIDGYISLLVSIFIIISAIKMLIEILEPIIGIIPTKERVEFIENKLLSYDSVKGIHGLVIHNYGVHNDFITVHVEVDSNMNMIEAHDLIDIIENDFKEELGIDLTIHMDPIIIGNKELDDLKNKIENLLVQLNSNLKIHDFRITNGKKHKKILFDCVVPYETEYTEEYLINYLKENIKNENHKYIIEIDRPFC